MVLVGFNEYRKASSGACPGQTYGLHPEGDNSAFFTISCGICWKATPSELHEVTKYCAGVRAQGKLRMV